MRAPDCRYWTLASAVMKLLEEGSLMAVRDLWFSRRTGRQSGPARTADSTARHTTAGAYAAQCAAEMTADAAFQRALSLAGLEGGKL